MDSDRSAGFLDADALLRLVHWASHASRHLRRRLAEVAGCFDLSDTELLVLWVSTGGGRVQVELASELGMSPAQTSGMVERLHRRGLITIRRQAVDRRRQVCETTAEGLELLNRVAADLNQLSQRITGELTASEQQTAEALCQRLATALKESCHQEKQRTSKEAA
jgi:DNA-binding MarR family transcriptional regulator